MQDVRSASPGLHAASGGGRGHARWTDVMLLLMLTVTLSLNTDLTLTPTLTPTLNLTLKARSTFARCHPSARRESSVRRTACIRRRALRPSTDVKPEGRPSASAAAVLLRNSQPFSSQVTASVRCMLGHHPP